MSKGKAGNVKEDNHKKIQGDKGKATYPVGYKKPPQRTQFKPGQSGNAKGRPKKRATVTGVVEKQLQRTVLVNVGGKVQRMSMLAVIAMKQISLAANGNHKAAALVFDQVKPAESTQNDNLPDLLQQFRAIHASRTTADLIRSQSVEPELDSTTDSGSSPKDKDDTDDKEKH
jgi:hypothetical protein